MGTEERKRILIVEDEDKLAKLLADQLALAGYETHAEAYGLVALRYAAEYQPDLVILDLRLPDIPGYEVCRELRKLYHFWVMPILMLTAMDKPMDQLRGFAYGADGYITKPFTLPEVLETVSQLLGPISPAQPFTPEIPDQFLRFSDR